MCQRDMKLRCREHRPGFALRRGRRFDKVSVLIIKPMDCRTKTAIGIYVTVLCLALLGKWTDNTSGAYDSTVTRAVQRIVKNAQRWDAVSRQDSDHITALLHSVYAIAYTQVAMTLLPESEVERATGLDIKAFEASIEQFQSRAIAALS